MLKPVGLIIVGIFMFFLAISGFNKDREFDSHGLKAVLDPVKEYTETSKQQMAVVSTHQSYSAWLSFRTASGNPVRVWRIFPDDVLPKFKAGEPVYIEYLPENPEMTRFPGERIGGGRFFLLLGLFAAGIGAVWIYRRKRS